MDDYHFSLAYFFTRNLTFLSNSFGFFSISWAAFLLNTSVGLIYAPLVFSIAVIACTMVAAVFEGLHPSFFPTRLGSTSARHILRCPWYSVGFGQKLGCQMGVWMRTNGGWDG